LTTVSVRQFAVRRPISLMYRSGVLLARTLLSSDEQHAYVRVLNYSTTPCTIPEEEVLAAAEAVEKQTSFEQENISTNGSDCDHVQCLIDSLPSSLKTEERRKAIDLIRRYAHILSKPATDFGRNNLQPHRIDTSDHLPIKQAMRRQSYALELRTGRNFSARPVVLRARPVCAMTKTGPARPVSPIVPTLDPSSISEDPV
jgi:hypothetical protein